MPDALVPRGFTVPQSHGPLALRQACSPDNAPEPVPVNLYDGDIAVAETNPRDQNEEGQRRVIAKLPKSVFKLIQWARRI